jgi:hypothetical protein
VRGQSCTAAKTMWCKHHVVFLASDNICVDAGFRLQKIARRRVRSHSASTSLCSVNTRCTAYMPHSARWCATAPRWKQSTARRLT